jgi:hypothetical protein
MKTVDIEIVIKRYHAAHPDGHWFDRDTLRFFGCRLPRTAFEALDGRRFFVTSEHNFDRTRRLFSVRVQGLDGDMDTIGEFQGYTDRATAVREAKRLANE